MSIDLSPVLAGTTASLLAGAATGLGGLPLLGIGRSALRYQGAMLGFAAGVMLAASFFSLIVPAVGILDRQGVGSWPAAGTVAVAVLVGGLLLLALSRFSLERFTTAEGLDRIGHRIWLLVAAITLHNAPEGLAVGVSFARDAGGEGYATALGIGIQNIPEGFAVGSALALRYPPIWAFAGALASGLVEPVFGALGAALVHRYAMLLPIALCLAAGAMISVVMDQIAPELGEDGQSAQASLLVGLAVMTCLDIALG
ncbi:ZIP family metal transporter [Sphingobium sp. TA15]|uniref:ZIP-family zinc transporter n=3 Tax=Sphingobium indicum TaxID=332055 RepID=D4YZZ2_SPHIU|nr:ZIP family metal transporter [Sphingobium indicum]KEY97640.1 ZIP-family zinc transporter [Sphingomonas sp. BHC-A]BDD65237.1 ZIP family metal transporter [Sphingobium sp. TA15]APL94590.1 ZIP-family zinc transporter [Sphingobium indicum B90A]NYI23273.1 ZIP family zinc transporter [Sphingobium indicum]RYM04340.1 ZIP family metal transporter [Sphingobium indicum]